MNKLFSIRHSIMTVATACVAATLINTIELSSAIADISYNIVNLPSYQNGYTLAGTITTDGHLGLITMSNIKDWTWTATNGINTYSGSSSQEGLHTGIFGPIVATSDYLALSLIDPNDGIYLSAPMPPPGYQGYTDMGLQFSAHSTSVLTALHWGDGASGTLTPWWTDGISPIPNQVADGFAFATVPEPSTLILIGVAIFGALVFTQRRRS